MPGFHPLTVTAVARDTADSLICALRPREEHRAAFSHSAGQHLALRMPSDAGAVQRSYSICSRPGAADLEVAIKRVPGGRFSEWAHAELGPGRVVEGRPPAGGFGRDVEGARRYALIAGGSGLSPIIAILASLLDGKPDSRSTLILCNRRPASVQFRDRLARLKDRHCGRLGIAHLFSAPETGAPAARLDEEGAARLLPVLAPRGTVDAAYICGPPGMMRAAARQLEAQGVAPHAIRQEWFGADAPGPASPRRPTAGVQAAAGTRLRLMLGGAEHSAVLPPGGDTLLDAMLTIGIELPHSCKSGVCATCRCRVLEGEVAMENAHALTRDEIMRGDILACRARPRSAELKLQFDD